MSDTFIAVIIGIVEGLTEFLPVSSTGHMILAGSLLGFEGEKASVFEMFIQLGAILSILILYRDKFRDMLFPRRFAAKAKLSAMHVAAGIIPVMGVGYLLHKPLKNSFFRPLPSLSAC